MATAKRRVSYILPSPVENVPRLQLPPHGASRLGATGPLLMQYRDQSKSTARKDSDRHPRHRLGVASLALDTSTQLEGRDAPEGILYSGGRDGLLMSWDLGLPMKKRKVSQTSTNRIRRGSWEMMTGWDDDVDDDVDEADDHPVSDGDVLGDVTSSLKKRRRPGSLSDPLPHERQWETDLGAFQPGTKTRFRQSAQAHTDWVNDILLCNYNQTAVSASSDGTVKAWNPHATTPTDPTTIGLHSDYVRCLAYCREQNWVASGSFDRTIKLWDLHHTSTDPLVTLNPPDALAPKSSVYALAADPYGRMIASGSPERVVRLWDPRTGKRTGKLVGHTDNIRAILVSEDSKYLLTGSADASVKIWSLTSQRCLHTFTHHTDSVWSLYSDHPSLEVFYSGDRSGLVCRVDVEDCPDISEGECLLLCSESMDNTRASMEGINKIVVMDDNLLWTATGTSTIRRWQIPQRRTRRGLPSILGPEAGRMTPVNSPGNKKRLLSLPDSPSEPNTQPSTGYGHSHRLSFSPSVQSVTSDQSGRDRDTDIKLNGIPYDSMVRLISPNDPFASYTSSRARDPEVATLYSAASVMSVPHHSARSPQQSVFPSNSMSTSIQNSRTEDTIMAHNSARAMYEERELAADALPFCAEPDDIIEGDHGLVRSIILNDRTYALTVDTAGEVAVWDIIRCTCLGRYPAEDVAAASHSGTVGGSDDKEHSPREALEAVRERIEGEAVVSNWCNADTKAGVLSIHLTERCFDAEVYVDEVGFPINDGKYHDESKLNMGKWVLRNLFIGFIKEETRRRQDGILAKSLSRASSNDALEQNAKSVITSSPESSRRERPARRSSGNATVQRSPDMIPVVPPNVPATARSSPLLAPLIMLHPQTNTSNIPLTLQTGNPLDPTTPTPGVHQRARSGTLDGALTPTIATPSLGKDDYFTSRVRQQSIQGGVPGSPDEFSGWTGPNKPEPQTPSTPSGLMGRLRNLGKITKRPVSDNLTAAALATPTTEPSIPEGSALEIAKTPAQQLLAGPLEPPTSADAPLYRLPPNTVVLISEESQPSYTTLYRGTVAQTQHDAETLEAVMPMWLLEYLLLNQIPTTAPPAKISFILIPWNRDPDVEPLPELLNTAQSKLTASRSLRVRKIVNHVQDKLERIAMGPGSRAASVRSFSDHQELPRGANRPRAEDEYEILCNETLLPLGMSLAAIRQYVWKQGTELVLHYRRKRHSQAPPAK